MAEQQSNLIALVSACVDNRRSYYELLAAYRRGDIEGTRSDTGRIFLDAESVKRYVAQRQPRAGISPAAA